MVTAVLRPVKQCEKTLQEQIKVVAEFHAYKIRAERIAYRTGIDLSLVQRLLNGSYEPDYFKHCVNQSRLERRQRRLQSSLAKKGAERRSIQEKIDADF